MNITNEKLNVFNEIQKTIGNTPLVRLNRITENMPGSYYAKMESFNPSLSVKDRMALHIITQYEKQGLIKKGGTIVETTSGNTGYSLAGLSILKGYRCILAVTDKATEDKILMLKKLGAEVHICPANVPPDHPDSYYQVGKRLSEEIKGAVYINQYFNKLNPEAYYLSLGPEIWKQTEGKITHFIACSGTGGTISGTAKYLKEQNKDIKVIGIDAEGSVIKKYHETGELDPNEAYPYLIEGLGKNLIPDTLDCSVIDEFIKVSDKKSALMSRQLLNTESIFAGYTSGAVVQGIKQLSEKRYFNKNSLVVVIFPDHGSRYQKKVYSDEWMKEKGFLD